MSLQIYTSNSNQCMNCKVQDIDIQQLPCMHNLCTPCALSSRDHGGGFCRICNSQFVGFGLVSSGPEINGYMSTQMEGDPHTPFPNGHPVVNGFNGSSVSRPTLGVSGIQSAGRSRMTSLTPSAAAPMISNGTLSSGLPECVTPMQNSPGKDDHNRSGWSLVEAEAENNGTDHALPRFSRIVGHRPTDGTGNECSCDERSPATVFCEDCNEDLCDECFRAHKRVKQTKGHRIVKLQSGNRVEVSISGADNVATTKHDANIQPAEVLKVYTEAMEKAKSDSDTVLNQTRMCVSRLEMMMESLSDLEKKIETRFMSGEKQLCETFKLLNEACSARFKELDERLKRIKALKLEMVSNQKNKSCEVLKMLQIASDGLANAMQSSTGIALFNACTDANNALKYFREECGFEVHEDESITLNIFSLNDLTRTIREFGYLSGSACAKFSTAEGTGIKKAIVGQSAGFVIVVRDQLGIPLRTGGDKVNVQIIDKDLKPVICNMSDSQRGTYSVTWKPNCEGDHTMYITIRGLNIQGSPFKIKANLPRNYRQPITPKFAFGVEGSADGELCRPWGISITKDGKFVVVANRSNNRIEIFTATGEFVRKFGSEGSGPNQFLRPSSVCCNNAGRLVVVDKDNHRIQVCTLEGEFILSFGEKGSQNGQFNYPWDVACSSKDLILVSDTRNHRIQLFSPDGAYLNKYGFNGPNLRNLDSPRGVCFSSQDCAIVTDFNNHRVLVVDIEKQTAVYLGQEGKAPGEFIRPNGVDLDDEGNLIVADSRNNRIQVFSSSGVFLTQFGSFGTSLGCLDRPSGIAVSPQGLIYIVDFGNNRIQVF